MTFAIAQGTTKQLNSQTASIGFILPASNAEEAALVKSSNFARSKFIAGMRPLRSKITRTKALAYQAGASASVALPRHARSERAASQTSPRDRCSGST